MLCDAVHAGKPGKALERAKDLIRVMGKQKLAKKEKDVPYHRQRDDLINGHSLEKFAPACACHSVCREARLH